MQHIILLVAFSLGYRPKKNFGNWKGNLLVSILLLDATGVSQFLRSEKVINPGDPITSIKEDLIYSASAPVCV